MIIQWLKSLFKVPQPVGSPQVMRTFTIADPTIAQSAIALDGDAWLINAEEPQTIRLFEVSDPGVEQCMATYRASLKTENLTKRAYLEMWCRLPGRGEFFSKGFHNAVKGTNNWASYEIPFYLKQGQRPDLIKLSLVAEGMGKIWIKDIELLSTPLA